MPEYPDIEVYKDAIRQRVLGQILRELRIHSPFLLRTVEPGIDELTDRHVCGIERMGKRIVIALGKTPDLPTHWVVLHLMVAGRLHFKTAAQKPPGKNALAIFTFDTGYLYLTEAGKKRRASLHVFGDPESLHAIDPQGLEVLDCDIDAFCSRFTASNHTLKRALTDPKILSGIGNAYSDEILHRAGLSPIAMTQKLEQSELERLFDAIRAVLCEWRAFLSAETGDAFPSKVTAFRPEMAVHGKFGQACPLCNAPVQRIRYASNETNYCPNCQTGGRVLADRALSRLLKKDWPRSVEELEKVFPGGSRAR